MKIEGMNLPDQWKNASATTVVYANTTHTKTSERTD